MRRNFVFRVVTVFFVFSEKSDNRKKPRTEWSKISYSGLFSVYPNHIKKFHKNFFPNVEKNRFEIFGVSSIFEQLGLSLCLISAV